jgi:hypothetical protein
VIEGFLITPAASEPEPAPRPSPLGAQADPEQLEAQARAMDRTGRRLARLLDELRELETELDELDQRCHGDGLAEAIRGGLSAELELAVDAYNLLRESAERTLQQLVLERESCGFRGHEVLERCYPLPDPVLTPELVLPLAER